MSTQKTVLITGSTGGIGFTAAEMLLDRGHRVILHARNEERAAEVQSALAGPVVIGDLASLAETRAVADQVASLGPLDAVIHNAGIYESGSRVDTVDGMERTFQVNLLAPYVLTALMPLPSRLVYVSSGLASGGKLDLEDLQRRKRRWSASAAYNDSKLGLLALTLGVARHFPRVVATAICPGWVKTRMGGDGAPTDLHTGAATQAWLATSDDPEALRTGRYLRHMEEQAFPPAAAVETTQDALLAACARLSGVDLGGSR